MEFTVPQFIEKEANIVGPLNFKQLIALIAVAGLCVFLYFTMPFYVFIVGTVILGIGAIAMTFIKLQNIPLPIVIKNFFLYLFKPRIYVWHKKSGPAFFYQERPDRKISERFGEEEKSPVKVSERSRLKDLSNYLTTKPK